MNANMKRRFVFCLGAMLFAGTLAEMCIRDSLYSVLKGIVNPLISEQFNLFTKESNIAVKQIRETSVIYLSLIHICAYLFIKIYEKSRSRAVRRGFD